MPRPSGAFTGDLSAEMLADAGATCVLVGHSERRQYHAETDADVSAKAVAAHGQGSSRSCASGKPGTNAKQGGRSTSFAGSSPGRSPKAPTAANLVVAYEPVWAIGTGLTPTSADVAEVHAAIRAKLGELVGPGEQDEVRILYGGSVKPSNAAELMAVANVDGALVGGASLVAADFLGIAAAYLG